MNEKMLQKWAELLLDVGKRNNLINFRDTQTSTIEVLYPTANSLFDEIRKDGSVSFNVFDPKIEECDDVEGDVQFQSDDGCSNDTIDEKRAFFNLYLDKVKPKKQVLLYSREKNPLLTIKNIDKKSRAFIEETGVNVVYMAFGFIHWKESDSSKFNFRAPLLLVPIELNKESAVTPYVIKTTEDDIILNPTFSYKMEMEYGIKLPKYDDDPLDEYIEKVYSIIKKLSWEISSECKIGIFSFLKINMYRDLKDNAPLILANQNIQKLLGLLTDDVALNEKGSEDSVVSDPLIDLQSVADADSSQIEAIKMAKSGKSFVLQGPPGTGKSQTITNIIAECLGDGKKVLFVSEKLAALKVVYEKLKQARLSEFCLELHSHKANKKDFIAEICRELQANKVQASIVDVDSEISHKKKAKQQLDNYVKELHNQQSVIGKSLYQLYEDYAKFRTMPDIEWSVSQISSKGYAYLEEATALLEQYVNYLPSIGYDYRKNPWYGYIRQDLSYQTRTEVKHNITALIRFLEGVIPLAQELSSRYGVRCTTIRDMLDWKYFFDFVVGSKIITPSLLNKERFDAVNNILQVLRGDSAMILLLQSSLDVVFDENIYKIDGELYYKKLTKQFNGIFSRIFNSEYRQLISTLRLCKKDGKRLPYKDAVIAMKQLSHWLQKSKKFARDEGAIKSSLGKSYNGLNTDWGYTISQMLILENLHSQGVSFGRLVDLETFDSEVCLFDNYIQRFSEVFSSYDEGVVQYVKESFDDNIFDLNTASCDVICARLKNAINSIDRLENWCHFRKLLNTLNTEKIQPYVNVTIEENIEPSEVVGAFKKLFYYQWIDSILAQNEVLSSFNRVLQDKAIETFVEKDRKQFEINKAKIRAKQFSGRPSLDMIASGSPISILLREGEKKRNQKPIRSLLSDTGKLIQKIKPCFLMSPLSVSTYLTPDTVQFDVVIFDEASQIFPQDAIGAIYRAKQLIVVGDSKQMPPSNFFNTSIEVEKDDEASDVVDFESILDICSTSMPQIRLLWHYRSRHEELITFSNKNFYDNNLITFPSPMGESDGVGVDYYHVEGMFDRQSHTNRKEAEFVVDLIYKNIEKFPSRSLGVIAFSVAQQELIEKILAKRRQNASENEDFFKRDKEEAFFVKNLETVQGDERDTIIFSIAYGIDNQGRLFHNFGPLNRAGGERRLNVAVTRAKYNVQLVSSMHYTDIDLGRTSSEGARLLREYLDFAENGNIALKRSINIKSYDNFDSEFETDVCDFLRSKGFSVDTQVGCSGFKIDIGLKHSESSNYVLAIECDGATYHSSKNARDRDRLRQEVLERMGWRFYRIWSTDWFRNNAVEKERLLDAATEALKCISRAKESKKLKNTLNETFEVAIRESSTFPRYKAVDCFDVYRKHWKEDFKVAVKEILKVEAPLAEELLLRRSLKYFHSEKLTSAVQRRYEEKMQGFENCGIIRRDGFLSLENQSSFQFRVPGDIKREIKHIAPEELAAGMFEIVKQNISLDKKSLYRLLAMKCGVTRIGSSMNEILESSLELLVNRNDVVIKGEQVSLFK